MASASPNMLGSTRSGVILSDPNQLVLRHRYRLFLSITGRVRFLSHLETVDTLKGALRRAGVQLALSQGMKPKPLVKVAMPRPVAVEAWNDVLEIELMEGIDPDQLALALVGTLPDGLVLQGIEAFGNNETSAAGRVAGATFRATFDRADVAAEELARWVDAFRDADELLIARVTPKQRRTVDVRGVVGDITVVAASAAATGVEAAPAVRWFARLTQEGSAKPEEILRALAGIAGRGSLTPTRIVRESITFADDGSGHVAEPSMVGADVPDGPEKPWGAC